MVSKYPITFGICTFNRKDVLQKSVQSLLHVKNIDKVNIRIFDDCSTDYDRTFLEELVPEACSIKQNQRNVGADKNTSIMYEDFLKSGDEWLLNADSDLIYHSDIIDEILRYQDKCGGFVTLFNCINHNDISHTELFDIKESVGAAGCLLHRDVVELILNSIRYRSVSFDTVFCKVLRENGYNLYATKQSFVQHIGVTGFNSGEISFDYGRNFQCDSLINAEIIEYTFETYAKKVNQFKNKKNWRIYNSFAIIPRKIDRYGKKLREIMDLNQ